MPILSHPLHGIWRLAPSPQLTETLAHGGLQAQILDCEHGAYDYATLLPDLLALERAGGTGLVRVSGRDPVEVQRCLDLGARGLVFPQLRNADDFARAAAMMDYAPVGTRGYNPFVRAGHYGHPSETGGEPDRPWFVPIIETLEAVEQLERITALQRIDWVYIGSYDLSAQLGCPGRMDAPELLEVYDRIFTACKAVTVPIGMMALSTEQARRLLDRGVQVLIHGVETHRIGEFARDIVSPLPHPATNTNAL